MDATTYAYDASSLHAAHGRAACCCSVIKCSGTIKLLREALQAGMTAQRKPSKNHEGGQEGGQPFSRISTSWFHTELKHEEKESTDTLLDTVKELGHAKDALLEVESARLQLWSQWRVFLQQSVIKWRRIHDPIPNFRSSLFLPRCKRLPIP